MTVREHGGIADHVAARKSQFDENAFRGIEGRDLHRSQQGSRGGADAGPARSLHARSYDPWRRNHGACGLGWRCRDRDQSARGCQRHHHDQEQDQFHRWRQGGNDAYRDGDAGAPGPPHPGLADAARDRRGKARRGGDPDSDGALIGSRSSCDLRFVNGSVAFVNGRDTLPLFEARRALAFHVAMHNIRDLGIRRLLEGYPRGVMKCATKTLPVRRSPGATFGRCVSRKNYRYCGITFCGSIGRADMIAFTASWMMISSNAMPRNALTTALSSLLISRMAWCAARRSSIRPINRRIRCLRSLSASRPACDARALAASCSES